MEPRIFAVKSSTCPGVAPRITTMFCESRILLQSLFPEVPSLLLVHEGWISELVFRGTCVGESKKSESSGSFAVRLGECQWQEVCCKNNVVDDDSVTVTTAISAKDPKYWYEASNTINRSWEGVWRVQLALRAPHRCAGSWGAHVRTAALVRQFLRSPYR